MRWLQNLPAMVQRMEQLSLHDIKLLAEDVSGAALLLLMTAEYI
jgi:hypothetical protein